MPESKLNVQMIRHTVDPELLIALSAKLCYAKMTIDDLLTRIEQNDQDTFVQNIMHMGHFSVLEHASFTFGIEGVSRALMAQFTRHRLASFSIQSQRYVSYEKGFGYIIPDSIKALGEDAEKEFAHQMDTIHGWYTSWQARLQKGEGGNEDARFVLPNATETRMIVTMNVRELRHFFSLRMCNRAQWEIRAMAQQMLTQCLQVAPILFEDAGPGCLRGICPEGQKTCGKAKEMKQQRQTLLASKERE